MKTYQFLTKTSGLLFAGAFLFSLTSCLGSGDESFILEDEIKGVLHVDGIPTDDISNLSTEDIASFFR